MTTDGPAGADMDEHAAEIIDAAIDELGARAGMWGITSEPKLQLFLLGCLKAELDCRVLDTVWDCRSRDFNWTEIDQLLGLDAATAQARCDDRLPLETDPP
ncbi:MAG: hypothetical protein ACR2LK_02165 [Solirubrobacteraceae bacterium]